jgi:hypothetical protein
MLFVRAVITGFGLAMGAALFRKHVAPRVGLDESKPGSNSDATPPPPPGTLAES